MPRKISLDKILVGMKCVHEAKPQILIGRLFNYDPNKHSFTFGISNDTYECSGAPIFTFDGYIIRMHQYQRGTLGEATDISELLNVLNIIKKLP